MTCLNTFIIVSTLLVLQAVAARTTFGTPFRPSRSLCRREEEVPQAFFSPRPTAGLDAALSLRGGDIQTVTSLSEVEDIIDRASQNNQLVVLDFTANNCPPCRMIAPIYTDLSNLDEFVEKQVVFLKVNVSDHSEVAEKYAVDGWPTFLLFQDGKVVDSIVGGQAAKAGLYGLVVKYA